MYALFALAFAPAQAASLDFKVVAPDGAPLSWSVEDVALGQALPAVTIPGEEGALWMVMTNLMGAVEGEALVQVDLQDVQGGSELGLHWVVQGDGRLDARQPGMEELGRATFQMSQRGVIEVEDPDLIELDLLLPKDRPILSFGRMAEQLGAMEADFEGRDFGSQLCQTEDRRGASVTWFGWEPPEGKEPVPHLRYALLFDPPSRRQAAGPLEGTCTWTTSEGEVVLHYRANLL